MKRAAILLLLLGLAACERDAEPLPDPAVTVSVERENLGVTATVDRNSIGIAGRIELGLAWSADEPGWTFAAPSDDDFAQQEWTVVRRVRLPERLEGGTFVSGARLTLEPFLPGRYEVGPMLIEATDAEGRVRELAFDAIPIEVRSALDEDPDAAETDAELGTIRDTLLTEDRKPHLLLLVGVPAFGLIAVSAAVFTVIRATRRSTTVTPADILRQARRAFDAGDTERVPALIRVAAGQLSSRSLQSATPAQVVAALDSIDQSRARVVGEALAAYDLARFGPQPQDADLLAAIDALDELYRERSVA